MNRKSFLDALEEPADPQAETPYSKLANAIMNGPCGMCGSRVIQGEKHKDGCPAGPPTPLKYTEPPKNLADGFAEMSGVGTPTTKAEVVERTDHAVAPTGQRMIEVDFAPGATVGTILNDEPIPAPISRPTQKPASVGGGFAAYAQAQSAAPTNQPPHVIVRARAGTGKTFTITNGLRAMKGCLPPGIVPSEEQAAIWEAMAQSKDARYVAVVSFNKPIALQLKAKVPEGVDSMTNHAMGFKAVTRRWRKIEVEEDRCKEIIAELRMTEPHILRQTEPVWFYALEKLVGLCKQNLVDGTDEEELDRLATHYEIEFVDKDTGRGCEPSAVYAYVQPVLERSKNVDADLRCDYNDMIWLPIVLDLPMFTYDVLCVDEAQDLNRCQQALVKKCGRRLILVGDPKQAIYGFAGADADSMPRMEKELTAAPVGCKVLPLTVTYRCGKKIVAEANKLVKDFYAHEGNGEGEVKTDLYSTYTVREDGERTIVERPWEKCYLSRVQRGDMVLCRVNAPLIGQCLRFLKKGIPAKVMGRNVGQGLISIITKSEQATVLELINYVHNYVEHERAKEMAKRNPSDSRLILIQDKADCLLALCEDGDPHRPIEDVITRIEKLFSDDEKQPAIRLSSIHKAKGLEADRVWFLEPEGATCPHPIAKSVWQYEQELNLRYVAITRAIKELIYVY